MGMSVDEILDELRKERWMKEWVTGKMALGVLQLKKEPETI